MWYQRLIVKLITYKLTDYLILILRNFQTDKKFQVRVNYTLSSVGNIQERTPQESSLSPTLYNIFNSGFPQNEMIPNCLFAYDSAILTQGRNIKFEIQTLQVQLRRIEYWCTNWRVATNTKKIKP
ncbi:hypothetical protein AVEN_10775-1 [Araneus ventricosus]|uniref:Uncharacterized protein n=1 Tax=Araneus ventricosus TaxID=182803 RepID=A0A4Y2N9W3_ARAVE|nr:hypothetical protein AVEN_10775-1 [Araneus ventricosus]